MRARAVAAMLAAVMGAARLSQAAPDCSISATLTSGPAPLGVVFHATEIDGDVDPDYSEDFRELRYRWTFDDPGSGTWAFSGKSKNEQLGAVAAHVFRNAGTYDVELEITAPDGDDCVDQIQIVVGDPDAAWASTQTECICNTASFSGCPSGATQTTDSSGGGGSADLDATFASHNADDRRVLLCTGGIFSQSSMLSLVDAAANGSMLGVYNDGSGGAPVVTTANGVNGYEEDSGWRVQGISWRTAGISDTVADGGSGGSAGETPTSFLGIDLDMVGFDHCVNTGLTNSVDGHYPRGEIYQESFCRTRNTDPEVGPRALFSKQERSAWLGMDVDLTGLGTPSGGAPGVLRLSGHDKILIAHGRYRSVESGILSLRTCTPASDGNVCPDSSTHQGHVVVSDNLFFDDSPDQRVIVFCSHSACDLSGNTGIRIQEIVVERNVFAFENDGARGEWFVGQKVCRLDVRNNLFDLRGATDSTFTLANWRTGPNDLDGSECVDSNRFFANTIYTDASMSTLLVVNSLTGTGHTAEGNLLFGPSITTVDWADGSVTVTANLEDDASPGAGEYSVASAGTGPFAAAIPARSVPSVPRLEDFELCPSASCVTGGTSPVDGGVVVSSDALDGFGNCREPTWDVGFHERGATACEAAPPPLGPSRRGSPLLSMVTP